MCFGTGIQLSVVSSNAYSYRIDLSTTVLPSYRSLLPPSNEPRNEVQRTSIHVEDERGVHGGEYSVRPNMQESMVFLRKLFTHQHQDGGKASFPNLLSPPDSPMRTSDPKVEVILAVAVSFRYVLILPIRLLFLKSQTSSNLDASSDLHLLLLREGSKMHRTKVAPSLCTSASTQNAQIFQTKTKNLKGWKNFALLTPMYASRLEKSQRWRHGNWSLRLFETE